MINIYCVTHKALSLPENSSLTPIQVGDNPDDLFPLRDNKHNHIADKNRTWSENTAFYYIWMNRPSDVVGFCHYRRFLMPPFLQQKIIDCLEKPYHPDSIKGMSNYASGFRIQESDLFTALGDAGSFYGQAVTDLLDRSDIVLPRSNPLPESGFLGQYVKAHPPWPIFELLALISKKDHLLARRVYTFLTQHDKAYWNNLFVTSWDLFDNYCRFLFPLLFELENTLQLPDDPYQKRVFAFLSERLFNFWIWNEGLQVAEIDWCMTQAIEQGTERHQRR